MKKEENSRLLIKDGELQFIEKEITAHDLYEEMDNLRMKVDELSDLIFELVDTKRGLINA